MLTSYPKRFKLDSTLIVIGWLATFAAWPFITRASLPVFTDAEMHAYRTFEIMEAWKAGVWYPRWAPDFFYAYGYPVFNYYSPLTYYLGAAYGWFFGGAAEGVKFVLVLSAYLGALGMYLFVRDRWGSLAGVVSAAAFSLAPYVLYIDPHARGDAPETFAIALTPFLLWAFARLRRTASPGDVTIAALTLAALIVSHNLMALLCFGLLLAWLIWDIAFGQTFLDAWVVRENPNGKVKGKVVAALAAAIVLGLGLAACMWLPAVLERDAIQFHNVAGGPGTYFDFRRFFPGIGELFAPALIFDLGATQMRFNYSVGLMQWLLGALGILTIFPRRTRRLSVLFFAFAALIFIYFMLPSSVKVWEALPLMAFLQFPTRLLGPTAVVLGILAGAAIGWMDYLPWRHGRLVFAAVAVAGCLAAAMPLMYPPPWPDFGPVSAQRILANELTGRGVGTTSANDFLPVGVKFVPAPSDSLLQSYNGPIVDKVNRANMPQGTQVTVVEHGPQHDRFSITSQTDFVLRVYTYYFPGWTAYVDGKPAPITPMEYEDWITFPVPAGTHDVLVRLEDTPVRQLGWLLTVLSGLGLAALGIWRLHLPVTRPESDRLPRPQILALSLILLGGFAGRYIADQTGWWRVRSTGNQVLVAQYQNVTRLEDNMALLGYDLPQRAAQPGETVPVTLYWKALDRVPVSLRVFVHFLGPDGQLWGQADKWHPADFPTVSWPLDRYVQDDHQALLRPDAPPGVYTVRAGLWNPNTGQRMRVLDANGNPTGADGVVLSTEFVVR